MTSEVTRDQKIRDQTYFLLLLRVEEKELMHMHMHNELSELIIKWIDPNVMPGNIRWEEIDKDNNILLPTVSSIYKVSQYLIFM